MRITGIVIISYAIITFITGLYIIISDKYLLSLLFYFAVGVVLLWNAYTVINNSISGIYITLILSIALSIVFGLHLTKTLTVFPGGMMFVSSIITMGFTIYALSYKKKNENNNK